MFDLINRLTGFLGFSHQVNPNQERSIYVIADNTRQTTLDLFLNPSTVSPHGEIVQSSSDCEMPVVSQRYPIDSSRS